MSNYTKAVKSILYSVVMFENLYEYKPSLLLYKWIRAETRSLGYKDNPKLSYVLGHFLQEREYTKKDRLNFRVFLKLYNTTLSNDIKFLLKD